MKKRCAVINTNIDLLPVCNNHSADVRLEYKYVDGVPLYIGLFGVNSKSNELKKRPLIIFVHGGSWKEKKIFPDQDGWMGDYLGFLARYYCERGFICASIDYRLMGDKKQGKWELIDLYEDCMDAVNYLHAHAAEYRIDNEHTVVLGESAGGYLAAAMVTLPFRIKSFIRGAILINPITDLSDERWIEAIEQESKHPLLQGKTITEKVQMLSPVYNLYDKPCPTLLIHGEKDTVVSSMHSEKYYNAVVNAGGNSTYLQIEDTDHAFLLVEYMHEINQSTLPSGVAIMEIDKWLDDFIKDKTITE